jgi:NAD(P)-dependent dehydrogenase (short-subunit alcohol dehydrogenase family)
MAERDIIVVTGAGGALGAAVVAMLVERGARIVAIDLPEAGERLTEVARNHEGHVIALPLDVLAARVWHTALQRIERELGPPTGAALVAGGWRGGGPLWSDEGSSVWRTMLEMNLETVRSTLQALLPGMIERRRGSLVVVGSRAAERPWESANAAAYAAAKAAVVALSQAVAEEARAHGVRVNAVLPSILDTAANRRAMPDADFSTWVTPRSLAAVISFLLSDDARDVSGAAVPVYGKV